MNKNILIIIYGIIGVIALCLIIFIMVLPSTLAKVTGNEDWILGYVVIIAIPLIWYSGKTIYNIKNINKP
jgi:hypothetical protein